MNTAFTTQTYERLILAIFSFTSSNYQLNVMWKSYCIGISCQFRTWPFWCLSCNKIKHFGFNGISTINMLPLVLTVIHTQERIHWCKMSSKLLIRYSLIIYIWTIYTSMIYVDILVNQWKYIFASIVQSSPVLVYIFISAILKASYFRSSPEKSALNVTLAFHLISPLKTISPSHSQNWIN